MALEEAPILYFCVKCKAGPWTKQAKGFNGNSIFSFHEKLGHTVEEYDEQKHSSIKDEIHFDNRHSAPKDEPMDYENSLMDAQRLEELLDDGPGNSSEEYAIREMIKLLISSQHMISIIDLEKELDRWCKRFSISIGTINGIVPGIMSEKETFTQVKQIAYCLGQAKKQVCFDKSQIIETAYWILGRYNIKRIELTGDLLFFNDQYYEKNAQSLIRRKARDCLIKSKNNDMNEIVRFIEDTCQMITWQEIEESTNLKCLKNGVYNIKTGKFTPEFDPQYIVLNQIPHNFDETATFEKIDEKVREIISDDADRQSYYDSLSTCLHPFSGIDFQFGGIGPSGTGKSELCDLSRMVLGSDNVGNAAIHLIATDQTTQKDVAFKMLNIDADLSNESIRHIDVIKKWITQDPFTARGIYEHSTTFKPMARLCFMANELYEIPNSDDADAIYERTHLIKITNKFRGTDKQIRNVMKKVATADELDGIITYLLKNSTLLYDMQNIHHPMMYGTVKETWNLHGNRIQEFINKWVERGAAYKTEQAEPWNKWLSYAIQKDIPAKDKRQFKQIFDELIGNTPTKTRVDDVQCYAYHGFRIKSDEEVAGKETLRLDDCDDGRKSSKSSNIFSVQ